MTTPCHVYRERKERQNVSAFSALIDTPGDLATGVVIPAEADVYVSTSSVLASTTHLLDVADREIGAPAAPANEAHHIGRLHRGSVVEKAAGAPGTVSVFVRDGMGSLFKFGQA